MKESGPANWRPTRSVGVPAGPLRLTQCACFPRQADSPSAFNTTCSGSVAIWSARRRISGRPSGNSTGMFAVQGKRHGLGCRSTVAPDIRVRTFQGRERVLRKKANSDCKLCPVARSTSLCSAATTAASVGSRPAPLFPPPRHGQRRLPFGGAAGLDLAVSRASGSVADACVASGRRPPRKPRPVGGPPSPPSLGRKPFIDARARSACRPPGSARPAADAAPRQSGEPAEQRAADQPLHQPALLRAGGMECLQQEHPQQLLRRDRGRPAFEWRTAESAGSAARAPSTGTH